MQDNYLRDDVMHKQLVDCLRLIIKAIGDDPNREGLRETPDRVIRTYQEMFSGYSIDPKTIFKVFEDGCCDEMVVVKNIGFVSCCEHHMLPFYGKAHIGYIPNGKIVGLSKLARLVEVFARRLQVQERMTTQITNAIEQYLGPLGSGCVIQAEHSCIACRGVQKQGVIAVTSSLVGEFRDNPKARSEFLEFVKS